MTVRHAPMRDGNLFFNHGVFELAGDSVVTHKHVRAGRVYLAAGSMSREWNTEKRIYTAPCVIPIPEGKHYKLTALFPNTVVSCVHVLQDGELSPPIME